VHRWKPGSQLPGAQNAIQLGVEEKKGGTVAAAKEEQGEEEEEEYSDDESGSDSGFGTITLSDPEPGQETVDEAADSKPVEETIFANTANLPLGRNAWRAGVRVKMGGLGFQPIVVDLLE
jgi:hypothetical protein